VLGRAQAAQDWAELRATVIAWCESGFNLVAAAAGLHIHRTTRCSTGWRKLDGVVGHPWRDHRAMLSLYVACLADQLGPQPGRG
jgi:carbohydrate diacid regulator